MVYYARYGGGCGLFDYGAVQGANLRLYERERVEIQGGQTLCDRFLYHVVRSVQAARPDNGRTEPTILRPSGVLQSRYRAGTRTGIHIPDIEYPASDVHPRGRQTRIAERIVPERGDSEDN